MCERCGHSGCEHDWRRWAPKAFNKGWRDGYDGKGKDNPYRAGTEAAHGYANGWYHGDYWRRRGDDG